jgi:hypothetical protein
MSTEGIDISGDWGQGSAPVEPKQATETPVEAAESDDTLELGSEEAPEVEAPQSEADEHPEEDKKHRNKPAHKRIAELTAKQRQAERERDELRAEIDRLKAAAPNDNQPQNTELKEPNPADYEFGEADPKYLRAVAKFEIKQELAQADAQRQQNEQRQRVSHMANELDSQWQKKIEEGGKKYQDFDEVVLESAAAGEWPCPPLVAMAISASDHGHDIAYHLASNPDEATKLANLAQSDPFEAIRQLGRLEGKFEGANDNAPARKVTRAPEPASQRVRGSSGQFKARPDTDSLADFKAAYGKELGLR